MSEPINIPPALVLGCNTPHGINILSDYIEEQTGHTPDFHQAGWSEGNCLYGNYGYDYNISKCDGTGDGYGYGFNHGDGTGSGCDGDAESGCDYGNSSGSGFGFGFGYAGYW